MTAAVKKESKPKDQNQRSKEVLSMRACFIARLSFCIGLVLTGLVPSETSFAQESTPQNNLSTIQRLEIMRSKLESMRRSLNNAISAMETAASKEKEKPSIDDPRERLRGLEK